MKPRLNGISAAQGGLSDLVRKLIDGGAYVNALDDLGQTPLHLAASRGRKDTVDMLIAKGADIKAVCRDGRTLLHCAAAGGLVDLMDRLIKDGFPVDGPDRYGRTPLLKAAGAEPTPGADKNDVARSWPGPSRTEKRSSGPWDIAGSRSKPEAAF